MMHEKGMVSEGETVIAACARVRGVNLSNHPWHHAVCTLLSPFLSPSLSLCLSLPLCLSACLPVCLSLCLSVCLFLSLLPSLFLTLARSLRGSACYVSSRLDQFVSTSVFCFKRFKQPCSTLVDLRTDMEADLSSGMLLNRKSVALVMWLASRPTPGVRHPPVTLGTRPHTVHTCLACCPPRTIFFTRPPGIYPGCNNVVHKG